MNYSYNNESCLTDTAGSNILIVEDSEFVNNTVKTELEKLGHLCTQAFTLEEALQLFKVKKYDFVILDLNLPDGYGEDLFFSIIGHCQAKIIILTSEKDAQVRSSLFKLGILDYILKDEHLIESVHKVNRTMYNIVKNKGFEVLIIDDSSALRKQVELVLTDRNYTILQAESAKEGLEILENKRVDLILLDLELPDIHGSVLLNTIKENPLYSEIPVLVLSGTNNPDLIRSVLKGGASDFIQKPFNVEEFVLKIDLWSQLGYKTEDICQMEQRLKEYKQTLELSAIVCITDKEGLFTYVSEKFCKVSGYTEEELISKSYTTVSDPESSTLSLSSLYDKTEGKKTWYGNLRIKKKNAQNSLVDTMINPIVDKDKNVIEYVFVYREA